MDIKLFEKNLDKTFNIPNFSGLDKDVLLSTFKCNVYEGCS